MYCYSRKERCKLYLVSSVLCVSWKDFMHPKLIYNLFKFLRLVEDLKMTVRFWFNFLTLLWSEPRVLYMLVSHSTSESHNYFNTHAYDFHNYNNCIKLAPFKLYLWLSMHLDIHMLAFLNLEEVLVEGRHFT